MHISARENPVIEKLGELKQPSRALDKTDQGGETGQRAEHRRSTQSCNQKSPVAGSGCQQREQQKGIKEEYSVTPTGAEIAPERSCSDELYKGQQTERNALPHRAAVDGVHYVVPPHETETGVDTPIRA